MTVEAVPGEVYPMVRADPEGVAEGLLLSGLTEEALSGEPRDHQIGTLVVEHFDPAVEHRFVQLDAYVRIVAGKLLKRFGQRIGREYLIDRQRHFRFQPRRHALGDLFQCRGVLDQLARPAQQHLARIGEPHLASDRLENRHPKLRFELVHGVIERRGALVNRLRRTGKAAVIDDRCKHLPLSQGHS